MTTNEEIRAWLREREKDGFIDVLQWSNMTGYLRMLIEEARTDEAQKNYNYLREEAKQNNQFLRRKVDFFFKKRGVKTE